MELNEVILKRKRDFNNSLCLTGIIPFLVFVYLLSAKVSSLDIFVGEIGYVVLITLIIFLMGIAVGRKMLVSLLRELVEKNRLAAISETTLTLSHEINNPLIAMSGNLELLSTEFAENRAPDSIVNRLNLIRANCERIREVTIKLTSLSKPVTHNIFGESKMIDLTHSQ